MSINIKDNYSNSPVSTAKTMTSTKTPRQKQPDEEATTADKVNLTAMAKQLHKLSSNMTANPPIDTDRIDNIKRAITAGAFEINPHRIAEKLLNLENAMMK